MASQAQPDLVIVHVDLVQGESYDAGPHRCPVVRGQNATQGGVRRCHSPARSRRCRPGRAPPRSPVPSPTPTGMTMPPTLAIMPSSRHREQLGSGSQLRVRGQRPRAGRLAALAGPASQTTSPHGCTTASALVRLSGCVQDRRSWRTPLSYSRGRVGLSHSCPNVRVRGVGRRGIRLSQSTCRRPTAVSPRPELPPQRPPRRCVGVPTAVPLPPVPGVRVAGTAA